MNGAAVKAYSRAKDGGVSVAPQFKVWEFACHDGSDTVFVSEELADVLEKIRVHFGKPGIVSSGYRTESHNEKSGGAAYSQHKYGLAADITISGVKPADIAAYAETLLPGRGGIGIYSRFCHVDVRRSPSRWKEET